MQTTSKQTRRVPSCNSLLTLLENVQHDLDIVLDAGHADLERTLAILDYLNEVRKRHVNSNLVRSYREPRIIEKVQQRLGVLLRRSARQ